MAYLKFRADQLFTGTAMLDESYVLITDEKGVIETITPAQEAGEDVQIFPGIICPGFINCHCHLELSHMKGLIPERTGLVDFVFKVITQRHFPEQEILEAIAKAETEMLNNGIIAVGDICNNTSTLLQKSKQQLSYYNFIEASGWLPSIAETRFERALNNYNQFLNCQPSTVNRQPSTPNYKPQTTNYKLSSIVPHAPYSVSEELWQLIQPYFQNKTVSIHNQETSFEDELFLQAGGDFTRMYAMMNIDNNFFKASGKSSLQTYFSKLSKASAVILVHNTFTKEEDIKFAKEQAAINNQQLFWCLCANANKYIEYAVPPVELLRNNSCEIVIGTDSLASNGNLNILDEIKTIRRNFPSIPLTEILQWATLNGAKALQMQNELGSFEKGKKPGVICINKNATEVRRII